MAGYGILRVTKLKKISNLKGSLNHAFREQETPNADKERKHENIMLTPEITSVDSALRRYERLKPTGKIRSDVVHAIEVLVTASPEEMAKMSKEEQLDYLKKSLDFCNAEFGENNLLHAQIHNDETTPHLTAFYIPVITKKNKKGEEVRKLNANSILGGKKDYSNRQTRFYEQVSKNYGLERGIIGSKAKHKTISAFYKELNVEDISANEEVIAEKLKEKAVKTINIEVDEPVRNIFGLLTSTEKVEKPFTINGLLSIDDVMGVLTPFKNGNSEIRRREAQALKEEAKKELRAEVLKEFQEREKALKLREESVDVLEKKNRYFQDVIIATAKKLGVEKIKCTSELETAIDSFLTNFDCVKNELANEQRKFSELNNKYSSLQSESNRYQFLFKEAERGIDSLRSENDGLRTTINYLKQPRNFDELKSEYYQALEEKTKPIIDQVSSYINQFGKNHIAIKYQLEGYNNALKLLDRLCSIDENFGRIYSSKRYEELKKGSEYINKNSHLMGLSGMSMGL